ncbi:NlpC/P60 family protein [Janibacter hoylei]|uniref:C40 family peptidase n=1 Tax=Janibacter hoylei TaxID=364298 RepID=UPI00223903ED|nr:NlpC/P60 family protein [Janibacter hoylei]MCW4601658.1 NlpC/P60 family protein [Janibacter hoylei]
MSMFYTGRHRTPSTSSQTGKRAGATMVAVAAVSLGTATAGAQSATAAPATQSTQSATAKASFSGLVKQGSRGTVVKQIQRKVGVTADGVFGPKTKAAVKRWQKRKGLAADGVVGPRTGTKMGLKSSSSRSTSTRSSRTSTRSVSSSSVLSTASNLVGTPYRSGGTTPSGFDCSGFTKYVYARHGKTLPRTAEQQRRSTTRVSSPRAGDLVFFGAPAWHVGIYAGNGKMYDAGNSRVDTTKRAIWTSAVTYGRV